MFTALPEDAEIINDNDILDDDPTGEDGV